MVKRPHTPVTIKHVADAAGVSRATVSRVFSQPQLLNAQTAEHVKEVAEKLGYVPNQTARALSTGRAGNIALIVPDIANPFFSAVIRGAQAKAWEFGYAMFIGDTDETPEMEELLLSKLAPQVEGFILASSRLAKRHIEAYAVRRPLVLLNRDIANIPRLLVDTADGYRRAVEHFADLGHRSIAYVTGPAVSWSDRQRRNAVRHAADRLGLAVSFVSNAKPTYEAGRACVGDLLRTGATAVLAFDDLTAQGIMSGLAEQGLSVPEDMSVVGCDGVLACTTYPPLSSVEARCNEVGEASVGLLLKLLDGNAASDRIVMPTELVVRSTTSAPAVAARSARANGLLGPAGEPL